MPDSMERRIIQRATQSHRILTRQELLAIGLGPRAITYRAQTGVLHREYPGVFAIGTPATHAYERSMAAVKACGTGSMLADDGALALWGFIDTWPRQLAILTPNNRRPKGLIVHRSTILTSKDRRVHKGVPVTSPARALLDAAVYLGGRRLTRVVNDALHTPHLKRRHLKELCALHPNHPGVKALRPFWDTSDGPTRADWEDDFPTWCVRRGMPRPTIGYRLGPFTVDAIFLAERLIVELDGWASHDGRDRFEGDRDRDAENLLNWHPTVRITWYRLESDSDREAARLEQILANRRVEVAALDAYLSEHAG